MSEPTNKNLSRRDALKLLGAAVGASVLANLPSRWSTPQSVAGVLPAHAATSGDCSGVALRIAAETAGVSYVASSPPFSRSGSMLWEWDCGPNCIFAVFNSTATANVLATVTIQESVGSFFIRPAELTWFYVNVPKRIVGAGLAKDEIIVEGCPSLGYYGD